MIKLAVIGYPISHSLSPVIHGAVMEHLNMQYAYETEEIKEEELEEYIAKVKKENIAGFNITMPHKQNIIKFLDSVDEEALLCGSVNTVKNEFGRLCGYSTDGDRIYDVSKE